MQRFSALSLLRHALGGHTGWQPQWRSPEPKPAYDALIIGGGGHGLATAYIWRSSTGCATSPCWSQRLDRWRQHRAQYDGDPV